jgi:hypothetical protein
MKVREDEKAGRWWGTSRGIDQPEKPDEITATGIRVLLHSSGVLAKQQIKDKELHGTECY